MYIHKRLCKYYLECIERDMDTEVSEFATSKFDKLDYCVVPFLPFIKKRAIPTSDQLNNVIKNVVQDRFRLNLCLGYPLHLKEITSKKGDLIRLIEPLFLFQFSSETVSIGKSPELIELSPQFNHKAYRGLTNASGFEIIREMIWLYDEIGLSEYEVDINWSDLFKKLHLNKSEWPWVEEPIPEALVNRDFAQMTQCGIYNSAAVFAVERSKYTKGLERELNTIMNKSPEELKGTSFNSWIHQNDTNKGTEIDLIEPLALNNEQRDAIQSALTNPLTVITGPPGTGKSQVVAGIIINSLYHNQKVLFSSRTHKAVDVVCERVNDLSNRNMLLKINPKNARGTLQEHLINLLSTKKNLTLQKNLSEIQSITDKLKSQKNKIFDTQKKLVDLRNHVDLLEQKCEELRTSFGNTFFQEIKNHPESDYVNLQKILDQLALFAENMEFREESSKFLGKMIRVKKRFQNINKWNKINNSIKDLDERYHHIYRNIDDNSKEKIRELREEVFAITKNIHKSLSSIFGKSENLTNFDLEKLSSDLNNRYREIASLIQNLNEESELNAIELLRDVTNLIRSHLGELMVIRQYYKAMERLKSFPTLFELTLEINEIERKIEQNSREIWTLYSELIPDKLTDDERKDIGEFLTISKMIVEAEETGSYSEKRIYGKYNGLLEKIAGTFSAWALSTLSINGKAPLIPGYFDLLIIDEASQCDIASVIPLLYRSKRVVVIGDSKQLRHISTINNREDYQFLERNDLIDTHVSWSYKTNSLFDLASGIRFAKVENLLDHHRSHSSIIDFSNKEFYQGKLRIATRDDQFILPEGRQAVGWVDVDGTATQHKNGGSTNHMEAEAVIEQLLLLKQVQYKGTIGVVTPFREQANLIRKLMTNDESLIISLMENDFLVDTVYKFQGDERDIMIFSPVYSKEMPPGSIRFLKMNANIFNVAITRARSSLITVGNYSDCSTSDVDYLKKFATYIEAKIKEEEKKEATRSNEHEYPVDTFSNEVSDWEAVFYKRLKDENITLIPQYQEGRYRLDFALICNQNKLNIEIDGEYYHKNWDGDLLWRDQIRNMRLFEKGWEVKRFWVYQVRDDLDGCVNEIKKWIAKNCN